MAKFDNHSAASLIGTALLSNTTLCEASRVLQWTPEESVGQDAPVVALRILDLLSLIDASVLYDRLYTLPGNLGSDIDSLELRSSLIAVGAVEQFSTTTTRDAASEALLGMLSSVELGHMSRSHVKNLQKHAATILGPGSDHLAHEGNDGFGGIELKVNSFDELTRKVMGSINKETSRYLSADPARALCYVLIAEQLSLPYWPSIYNRPLIAGFPNYFSRSARATIYASLSEALRSAAKTVAHEFEGTDVFIPPFSALVLERAATPEEIPAVMLAVRQEFENFRGRMAELEHERAIAKSIAKRLKTMERIESLCREVSRPFSSPSQMKLKSSLKYVPDIAELAASPTNPATWTKVFLERSAEWIITWYSTRPVLKLVKTAKAVAALDTYDDLLQKHFGADRVAAVKYSQTQLQSLLGT